MTWLEITVEGGSLLLYLAPLVIAVQIWRRRRPLTAKKWAGLSVATVGLTALLPVVELVWLFPLDNHARRRWLQEFHEGQAAHWGEAEVRARYGDPCNVRHEKPCVQHLDGSYECRTPYTAWDYVPVNLCWICHAWHFKVFFADGVMTSVNSGV